MNGETEKPEAQAPDEAPKRVPRKPGAVFLIAFGILLILFGACFHYIHWARVEGGSLFKPSDASRFVWGAYASYLAGGAYLLRHVNWRSIQLPKSISLPQLPRPLLKELLIYNAPLRYSLRRGSIYSWKNLFMFLGVVFYAYIVIMERIALHAYRTSKLFYAPTNFTDIFLMFKLFGGGLVCAGMLVNLLFIAFRSSANLVRAYPEDWRATNIHPAQVLLGVVYAPLGSNLLAVALMFLLTVAQCHTAKVDGATVPIIPPWYFWFAPSVCFLFTIYGYTALIFMRSRIFFMKSFSFWTIFLLGSAGALLLMLGSPSGSIWSDPIFAACLVILLLPISVLGFKRDFVRMLRVMSLPPDSWQTAKTRGGKAK